MKIEICGLRTPGDANEVNELMPDYIGFVLTEGFKKTVSEETAQLLSKFVDPMIGRVGVFVNDDPSRIKRLLYNGLIDIVQLAGDENDEYISELKSGNGSIVKTFKVGEDLDLQKAEESNADMIMFELEDNEESDKLDKLKSFKRPFILSGNFDAEKIRNLRTHLKDSGLYAVSVGNSPKASIKYDVLSPAVNEAHAV